jgi:hypothetical protein
VRILEVLVVRLDTLHILEILVGGMVAAYCALRGMISTRTHPNR